MAGRPPPGNAGNKERGTGSSGPFGQQRQGGSDTFFGNFNAGGSAGSAGNGAGPPQGGLQFGTAGFGFNAGPQGNQIIQRPQGGSGNLGFPQVAQGGQGSFPPQEFNLGGGFVGNAPRHGGQGNGNQRFAKSNNYRGGRPNYRARGNPNQGASGSNAKNQAGSYGLDHKKTNLGESSSTNASGGNLENQTKGKKKAKKESCYRCGSNGHLFSECTAVLCEYCEQVGHNPDEYHLLSAPKPQIILHGISDEKLMFFECPTTKSYRPKLKSTRLGLLSVTGGELSTPAIVAQLQRLVPVENFAWECRQVGHNVFKVTFPDREEIERLARFGTFQVPNSRIQLTFEQCVSSMEPISKLPEIWILMSGIPQRRIGDFLAMWSLGTLFGKTLKVDMKYTREKGVLRILVGCLDFKRIPAKKNIFIGDGFYDISFEVEIQRDLEMVAAANPGEEPSDNDGHGNNGDSTSKSPKKPRCYGHRLYSKFTRLGGS
jgi:hypothetical protein